MRPAAHRVISYMLGGIGVGAVLGLAAWRAHPDWPLVLAIAVGVALMWGGALVGWAIFMADSR